MKHRTLFFVSIICWVQTIKIKSARLFSSEERPLSVFAYYLSETIKTPQELLSIVIGLCLRCLLINLQLDQSHKKQPIWFYSVQGFIIDSLRTSRFLSEFRLCVFQWFVSLNEYFSVLFFFYFRLFASELCKRDYWRTDWPQRPRMEQRRDVAHEVCMRVCAWVCVDADSSHRGG